MFVLLTFCVKRVCEKDRMTAGNTIMVWNHYILFEFSGSFAALETQANNELFALEEGP
jgi:hypothetical protein